MEKLLYFNNALSYDNKKCSLSNKVISYVNENKSVNIVEGKEIVSLYDVTSTDEETFLCKDVFNVIKSITIDGKEIDKVSAYTFNEIGEHKVIYKLDNCDDVAECPMFSGATALTYIKLPNNVRGFSDSTKNYGAIFADCVNLKHVEILYNGNVTFSFPDKIFYNCSSLTELTFPRGKFGIGDVSDAFTNCSNIKKIIFPKGLYLDSYLSRYPFTKLTNLEEVIFENGCYVRTIMDAFTNCTKIKKVFIGDGIQNIYKFTETSTKNYFAFNDTSIESLIVDKNNPYYDSRENCNCIIKTDTNEILFAANGYTIPSSVEKISADKIFYDNSINYVPENIKEFGNWMCKMSRNKTFYFGEKFEKFGANCFYFAYNIKMYFTSMTPPIADDTCFYSNNVNDSAYYTIYYPKGSDYSSLMSHPYLQKTSFIEYEP